MSKTKDKPRRLRDGELMLSMDEVIQISRETSTLVFGVATFRAQVHRGTRTTLGGWTWRVWDALATDVGGSGFNVSGTARTKDEARVAALALLRSRIP